MASVKIILRTNKKNKEGKHPLAIQIIKDRRPSLIHLGYYLHCNEWDDTRQQVKKSHPYSIRLNNFIRKKIAEASDKAIELETEKNNVSSRTIKQKIKPSIGATFFPQARSYLDMLVAAGKYNRYSADKSRIERFREFLKGNDSSFSDITVTMLEKFKAYLKGTRQITERTAVNHLVVIRSVCSHAIKGNIVDPKYYPFGKGKMKIKFPDSTKIGLTMEEVKSIEKLSLIKNTELYHARNIWLFSFYFAGMRISDVLRLKWSDFQNDRLYYTMGKNEKAGSLKVPDKALKILTTYKRDYQNHLMVFPYLECISDFDNQFDVQKAIKYKLKTINQNLKKIAEEAGIKKKLTMHISRHTFGNISEDKISIRMLQKLYRHSSITTTMGYQAHFIHTDADEALDAVIEF